MLRNSTTAWGSVARGFHWGMAVLVGVQLALGAMAVTWRVSPAKVELFFWHKSLGFLIFALLALRLAWRAVDRAPPLPAAMPDWERTAARANQALLYALLALLPLSGWIVNSAANVPFRIFRIVPLPAIVPPDEAVTRAFARVHLGFAMLLLLAVAAHAGAAWRHHRVRRDDVLARMLPWGGRT